MPLIIGGAFLLGLIISYLLFARPIKKNLNERMEELKASQPLLSAAKDDREKLTQKIADLEYQLKEMEKDLSFERSKEK